jgi:hypothetical protein
MDDMPDFENESRTKLRWYIENFPSPHQFFKPAMAALERKEAEEESRRANPSAIHIRDSNVANLNVGSQVGAIAAQTRGDTITEFNDHLRQVVRVVDMEWSLLNRSETPVMTQTICKQVDDLRAALAILYGKCPSSVESKPLSDAIEKLDATRNYRMGNQIGSRREADQVAALMEAALTCVHAMVSDAAGSPRMDSKQIIALIKARRDEYHDRSLAAGPGTTDESVIESAQKAWEFEQEYNSLLAAIEATGSHEQDKRLAG